MSAQDLEKIRREVEEIGALPTLPQVLVKVLQLAAAEESSMEDISRIVERDPALTANILKLANSPYYGLREKVASLKLALTILGLNEIISIITSISIVRVFGSRRRTSGFDRTKFWRHSFGCAAASQMLARELRFDVDGVDFVAGLIHDIGKLIIDQYFHSKLKEIQSLKTEEDIPLLDAEARVMGVDHAVLGSWLAQRWHLPAILVESITYHHSPLDVLALATPSHEPALTAIVHLADILAQEPDLNFTESVHSAQSFSENLAWKIILAERPDLDKETLGGFIDRYEEYREKVSSLVEAVL
ncbi:MAG: HDOD domain-containing protein [Candidatus Hydrogenedentota bacterium]|nr:MAG: HDOD domain-containing protein [Candidatus Hydrogenedentota bacterium]